MGHKPTLGGLKSAQEFLSQHGYNLSTFQTIIYRGVRPGESCESHGQAKVRSLSKLIEKYGENCPYINVRLIDKRGILFVQFCEPKLTKSLPLPGRDAVMQFSTEDPDFKAFMKSKGGHMVAYLASL